MYEPEWHRARSRRQGRLPEEGVVRLATLGADRPTGTFTDEAGELAW